MRSCIVSPTPRDLQDITSGAVCWEAVVAEFQSSWLQVASCIQILSMKRTIKDPPSSSSGGAAKPKETIQKRNCSTPEPEGFLHNKVALAYYLVAANPCPVVPLPCMPGFMLSSRFPRITHKTYKQNVLS